MLAVRAVIIGNFKTKNMSLGVYLKSEPKRVKCICSNCSNEHYTTESEEIYSANITHNLGKMADAAGIYDALWRPYKLKDGCNFSDDDYDKEMEFERSQTIRAKDLIGKLALGVDILKSDPKHFEQFNASNGWGLYEHFVPFVEKYLQVCVENPDALVGVSR